MSTPTVTVELGLGTGWEDVSAYADLGRGITIECGRQDEQGVIPPGRCSLSLDGSTGKFAAYAPWAIGMGLRVSADAVAVQNLADADSASFEASVGDWVAVAAAPTLATDATRAWSGARSLKVTATAASGTLVGIPDLVAAFGLRYGRTYRYTARLWVPTATTPSFAGSFPAAFSGVTGKDQWVTITQTALLTPTANKLQLGPASAGSVGDVFWLDGLHVEEMPRPSGTLLDYDTASFETNAAANLWTRTGIFGTWTSTHPKYGASSLRLENAFAASSIASPVCGVDPNLTYTASIYAQVATALSCAWTVGIRWYDATGTQIGGDVLDPGYPIQAATGAGWQRGSCTAVAPAGAQFAALLLRSATVPSVSDVLWVDGAMFALGSTPGTFPAAAPAAATVNIAPNPCLETTTTSWSATYGTSGAGALTRSADLTAPSGSGYVALATWSTGSSAVGGGITHATMIGSAVPGTWSVRAQAKCSKAQRLAMTVTWWSAAGSNLGSSTSTASVVDAGAWTVLALAGVTAPVSTSYATVAVAAVAGTGGVVWAVGDTLAVSAVQIEQAAASSAIFNGFTTVSSARGRRFTGRVTSFPISWPGGGQGYSRIDVRASDRMADLAHVQLGSIIDETIRSYNPVAYYTLGEPQGAVTAGDTSGYGRPPLTQVQSGSGGTLTFSTGTGPGTDGHGAPQFDSVDDANGKFLDVKWLYPYPVDTQNIPRYFSWHVVALTSTVGRSLSFMRVQDAPDHSPGIEIGTNSIGQIALWRTDANGVVTASSTAALVVADGLTHDYVLTGANPSGTWNLNLYVDGVLRISVTGWGGFTAARMTIGGSQVSPMFEGTLAHVAVFGAVLTAGQIADLQAAIANGFTADLAYQRIARYLGFADITADQYDLETSATTVQHLEITGKSLLDACQAVTETENGTLYAGGDNRITFHARTHRYSRPSVLTLPVDNIGADTALNLDDQALVNTCEVATPAGATQSYADQTSIAQRGLRPEKVTRLADNATALSAAQWRVNTSKDPAYRLADVDVDLLTVPALLASQVQALRIDDVITVSGLPSQAPASSMRLFVEGWRETIALTDWSMAFNTSPATLYACLVLDDPALGLLDASNRIAY